MTVFLQWLGQIIGEWWTWLSETNVPGCSFTFAAMFLALLVLDFGIFILKIVFTGDTQGGARDVRNQIHKKNKKGG